MFIKTPESFKKRILKSCIYNPNVEKENARKTLKDLDNQRILTVDTNEILSTIYKDYCENCIIIKKHDLIPKSSAIVPAVIKQKIFINNFKYRSFIDRKSVV